MITLLIFIIAFIFFFFAFFSLVESALFAISDSRIATNVKNNVPGSKNLLWLKDNLDKTIVVIVVLNNIINILGSILVGIISTKFFNNLGIGILSGFVTIGIILVGEIIPKGIGVAFSEKIAHLLSTPVKLLVQIFSPFLKIIILLTKKIHKTPKNFSSQEEILYLAAESKKGGVLDDHEYKTVENIFKLDEIEVSQIMTPKNVITALCEKDLIEDKIHFLEDTPHSRIIVYGKSTDNIIGIVKKQDLLFVFINSKNKTETVKKCVSRVPVVSPKMTIRALLKQFQKIKIHIAVVKDSFGTILGIVTLEDVLEEIVGDIVDETDKNTDLRVDARIKNTKIK